MPCPRLLPATWPAGGPFRQCGEIALIAQLPSRDGQWAENQTSRAFAIATGDTSVEANVSDRVVLSAVDGASVATGSATGTIIDDDG